MSHLILTTTLVFFTFDDGPAKSTDQILPLLRQHGVKATFFVLGCKLQLKKNRDRLRLIAQAGHRIGNHLWSHKSPCKLGLRKTLRELSKTQAKIETVLGRKIPKLYRPPHGHMCYARYIRREGYKIQLWTPGLADLHTGTHLLWHRLHRRLVKFQTSTILFHHHWKKLRFVLGKLRPTGQPR